LGGDRLLDVAEHLRAPDPVSPGNGPKIKKETTHGLL